LGNDREKREREGDRVRRWNSKRVEPAGGKDFFTKGGLFTRVNRAGHGWGGQFKKRRGGHGGYSGFSNKGEERQKERIVGGKAYRGWEKEKDGVENSELRSVARLDHEV